MKAPAAGLEEQKLASLFKSMAPGNVYFVTGKNGSGKSRFFAYASAELHLSQIFRENGPARLLCLSGTMHDKFPPNIYKAEKTNEKIVYLGNKVNNNMVSDTSPFRTLCSHMLQNYALPGAEKAIRASLDRLNLEGRITFKFRYGKSRKAEIFDSIPPQLDYFFSEVPNDPNLMSLYMGHISSNDIIMTDILFYREDKYYRLSELSSGEKQYFIALFGIIYCGKEGCVVFYDEPENSLHPSWQLSIIKDLSDIAHDVYPKSTIIVATHSPLIASSVRNGNVYVCDLPAGQAWQHSELFGRASDTVLREQFHLYSARSPEVSELINKCLYEISHGNEKGEKFKFLQEKLSDFNLNLLRDDPLYEVVSTIMRF